MNRYQLRSLAIVKQAVSNHPKSTCRERMLARTTRLNAGYLCCCCSATDKWYLEHSRRLTLRTFESYAVSSVQPMRLTCCPSSYSIDQTLETKTHTYKINAFRLLLITLTRASMLRLRHQSIYDVWVESSLGLGLMSMLLWERVCLIPTGTHVSSIINHSWCILLCWEKKQMILRGFMSRSLVLLLCTIEICDAV